MTNICEGSLIFSFNDMHDAFKYDEWPFYRERFIHICNTKAVDIICVTNDAAWLIEIKDYRIHRREKKDCIADEIAQKVRDTLASLAAAVANGSYEEQELAKKALSKHRWRVVLHIEQVNNLVDNISNLQIKLQQRLEAIDSKSLVTSTERSLRMVPWMVQADS